MSGQHRSSEEHRPGWWALAGVGFGLIMVALTLLIWFPWWGALLLAANFTIMAGLAFMLDFFVGWNHIWKELTGR